MGEWEDRWGIPHNYDKSAKTDSGSGFIYRGHRLGNRLADVPLRLLVTVLATGLIWAVNILSPGSLSFITGHPFIDSVLLGAAIGALYILFMLRAGKRGRDAEEVMEDIAREKKRVPGHGGTSSGS